ncbi:uncharacterized protein YutE (UPF0331/DUF86 family) [Cerasibacillus quisquiliarum]|uniref:Uncharacterized protein n=1 Tax=Cerasibacillus quisquiliarum TaxID=227865 RepID=A0A511UT61_9BACI|nr:DUF86 domain-containing protein [Cerasibacillus quisquiliarum]MBB5145324.1 uncharacterized protein YutE (UPF0331/DUF86 family) [Cerasibacillus quisquiliarum]GEN29785.1 hypothetical protein CQU01_00230 [Cerasibacillus quisquiliarum]
MYFVDRSKIIETLTYIDDYLNIFDNYRYETRIEQLALERLSHMLIEAILDTGNLMIDGFIMRDPGSYEDIIDILIDEEVIPKADESAYKEVISLRKMLVNDYLTVDQALLKETMQKHVPVLRQFSTHIKNYLDNELGVANAFSKE